MSVQRSAFKTSQKALWLVLAALALAVVVNLLHPKRIPWVGDWANRVEAQAVAENMPLVQLADLLKMLRDGSHLLVDARPADEYVPAHLPGAISLPFQTLETVPAVVAQVLSSQKPPVVYCTGPECDDSLLLALELRKLGRSDIAVFIGGMELWQEELLDTEGEAAR
jgi:rhodanese-related sulfurtransferase